MENKNCSSVSPSVPLLLPWWSHHSLCHPSSLLGHQVTHLHLAYIRITERGWPPFAAPIVNIQYPKAGFPKLWAATQCTVGHHPMFKFAQNSLPWSPQSLLPNNFPCDLLHRSSGLRMPPRYNQRLLLVCRSYFLLTLSSFPCPGISLFSTVVLLREICMDPWRWFWHMPCAFFHLWWLTGCALWSFAFETARNASRHSSGATST